MDRRTRNHLRPLHSHRSYPHNPPHPPTLLHSYDATLSQHERLEQEYKDIQTELSPLYADVKKLWAIHYNIYEVQHEQERQNSVTQQKKQEIEH